MSATGKIDPRNPPDWIKKMIEGAVAASDDLSHMRAEVRQAKGAGSARIVALGTGAYAAPLPQGWSFHRGRPYEGRIRPKEGYDIHFRIDSYEDADAAAGSEALMRYVSEPEFKDDVKTPGEVLNDLLVSIPGKDAAGRDIVWKCVEPFRGTHVRELVFRCPLVTEELVENRVSIARAISEWMNLGRFSPERTPLDRTAHSATLERMNFQDTVLMRVPRGWEVDDDGEPGSERKLYAVFRDDAPGTIWVTSKVFDLPENDDPRTMHAAVALIADKAWKTAGETGTWISRRREETDEGDLLYTAVSEEEDRGEMLRRITWTRWAIRDDVTIMALIHFVTPEALVETHEQRERTELIEREVRNAIFLKPPT